MEHLETWFCAAECDLHNTLCCWNAPGATWSCEDDRTKPNCWRGRAVPSRILAFHHVGPTHTPSAALYCQSKDSVSLGYPPLLMCCLDSLSPKECGVDAAFPKLFPSSFMQCSGWHTLSACYITSYQERIPLSILLTLCFWAALLL